MSEDLKPLPGFEKAFEDKARKERGEKPYIPKLGTFEHNVTHTQFNRGERAGSALMLGGLATMGGFALEWLIDGLTKNQVTGQPGAFTNFIGVSNSLDGGFLLTRIIPGTALIFGLPATLAAYTLTGRRKKT